MCLILFSTYGAAVAAASSASFIVLFSSGSVHIEYERKEKVENFRA